MDASKALVFKSDTIAKIFVEKIVERSKSFLYEEGNILVKEHLLDTSESHNLVLKSLTAIITVEDSAKMILAFSYEKGLIEKLFESYSGGIEIDPDEVPIYIEETAGDMLNIVLGNVLASFQQPGIAFAISTPLIVHEAKSISKYKNTQFYSAEIKTEAGNMSIYCITPGEVYNKHFRQRGVV